MKKIYNLLVNNWNYYKAGNPTKKLLLVNYLFWVLFYRRIVCNILALPLVALYFLLFPFIKFRFIRLIGSAIGHFAITTELLLCELDTKLNDSYINIFYIENSLYEPAISNQQLYLMWKRTIFILPLSFSGIVKCLARTISFFLKNTDYDRNGRITYFEHRWTRDVFGYLEKNPPHLAFTATEHQHAKSQLKKLGIAPEDKYICLLVRSAAYNKGHPTWNVPERNADLTTYFDACQYLAEKGYHVLRMGKVVDDYLPLNRHPKFIDYARSEIRSDFMDIYLSAHCHFFVSTGSGLDEIPQIFRKPVLYTNMFSAMFTSTWWPHRLFITKKLFYKSTKKLLTFKEQEEFLLNYLHTRKSFHLSHFMEKHDIGCENNTAEEILLVVKEMEARMAGTWVENKEDVLLQDQFWHQFPKDAKTFNPREKTNNLPLSGKISVKMGSQFLQQYQHLLSPTTP